MSEFMFRVRLEFRITPTETTDAHGDRNNSPNLNLHIADLLKSAGILCNDNDPNHGLFSYDLLPDTWTWVVGNTTLMTGDHKRGQCIVYLRSPPFPMEIDSFQIIDRVCTLLKNKYIIEYPIDDCMFRVHISKGIVGDFGYKLNRNMFAFLWTMEFQIDKFHPVEIVTSEDGCKQPLHSPWNCVVSAMKEIACNCDD